jgi:hypothetical protein
MLYTTPQNLSRIQRPHEAKFRVHALEYSPWSGSEYCILRKTFGLLISNLAFPSNKKQTRAAIYTVEERDKNKYRYM